MIDNEKIKAIIKQYAEKGKKMYSETIASRGSRYNAGFWDGYECCAKGLLRELEDMQEEPTIPDIVDEHFYEMLGEEPSTSVWHKVTEEPKAGKWILLQHSEGWYHVGLMSEGKFDKLWVSDGTAAFLLPVFSKWAYIDDLLKL